MGSRTVANSLVKRTTFSSAINIFPNEVAKNELEPSISSNKNSTRPYSEIPGPKELPLIGNSWRFAPIIGKLNKNSNLNGSINGTYSSAMQIAVSCIVWSGQINSCAIQRTRSIFAIILIWSSVSCVCVCCEHGQPVLILLSTQLYLVQNECVGRCSTTESTPIDVVDVSTCQINKRSKQKRLDSMTDFSKNLWITWMAVQQIQRPQNTNWAQQRSKLIRKK